MAAVWEHKLLKYELGWKGFDYAQIEQDLNTLGAQGWETVGTLTPGLGNGHTQEITLILKRAGAWTEP